MELQLPTKHTMTRTPHELRQSCYRELFAAEHEPDATVRWKMVSRAVRLAQEAEALERGQIKPIEVARDGEHVVRQSISN